MSYMSIIYILRIIIEIIGLITIIKFIRRMQIESLNYIKKRLNCIKLKTKKTYAKIQFLFNLPNIIFIMAMISTSFEK
jgi:hypothetical protein